MVRASRVVYLVSRAGAPALAALHPVAAVVACPLSLVVAMNGLGASRELMPAQPPITG